MQPRAVWAGLRASRTRPVPPGNGGIWLNPVAPPGLTRWPLALLVEEALRQVQRGVRVVRFPVFPKSYDDCCRYFVLSLVLNWGRWLLSLAPSPPPPPRGTLSSIRRRLGCSDLGLGTLLTPSGWGPRMPLLSV